MARVRTRRPKSRSEERSTLSALVPTAACLLFFALPLVFTTAGLDTFRLPKSAFALAAISWLLTAFVLSRKWSWPHVGFTWEALLVLGLGYAAFHTFFVSEVSDSLPALISLALYSLLLIVLRLCLDNAWQQRVWMALLAALSVDAVLTVLQYHQLLSGMTTGLGRSLGKRLTPAGFIGNTNTGGFLFVVAILMLTPFVVAGGSVRRRSVAGGLLLLNLVALAHTRTLSAVAALCICGALGLAFHHWWLGRFFEGAERRRSLFLTWAIVAILGFSGLGLLQLTGTTARIRRAVHDYRVGDYQHFASGRLLLFQATWGMATASPVFGHGLDRFGPEFFYFMAGTDEGRSLTLKGHQGAFREAHNEYLQTWSELGIAGISMLVALAVWPLTRLRGRLRREQDPATAYWIGCLALALVAVIVVSLAFFPLHLALTAAVVVLIVASLLNALDDFRTVASRTLGELVSALRRPAFLTVSIACVVLSVVFSLRQSNRWVANRELSIASGILEESAAGRVPADRMPVFVAEARRRVELAGRLDCTNPEVNPLLGTAYFLERRYDEAAGAYEAASRNLPSPELLTNLAAAHLARSDLESARAALDLALAYDPRYRLALQAQRRLEEMRERN